MSVGLGLCSLVEKGSLLPPMVTLVNWFGIVKDAFLGLKLVRPSNSNHLQLSSILHKSWGCCMLNPVYGSDTGSPPFSLFLSLLHTSLHVTVCCDSSQGFKGQAGDKVSLGWRSIDSRRLNLTNDWPQWWIFAFDFQCILKLSQFFIFFYKWTDLVLGKLQETWRDWCLTIKLHPSILKPFSSFSETGFLQTCCTLQPFQTMLPLLWN